MPFSYKAGIKPNVGLDSLRNSSIFEGIQNAMNMYMKLKDQEQQDKWKERELNRQDLSQGALSDYYKANAANLTEDNQRAAQEAERKIVEGNLNRSAGQKIANTDPFIARAEKAGYPKSLNFTPETTLPSSRFNAAMGGLPQGGQGGDISGQLDSVRKLVQGEPAGMGNTPYRQINSTQPGASPTMPTQGQTPINYFQAPGEDTGMSTINIPASERARLAAEGNTSREKIAADKLEADKILKEQAHQDRVAQMKQQDWYHKTMAELRAKGLNLQASQFSLLMDNAANNASHMEWSMAQKMYEDAHKQKGLAGILEVANGIAPGSIVMPTPPTLNTTPGRPGAPNRLSPSNDPFGIR